MNQLLISPIALLIILVYVSGLAFSIGRIYEQLRQAKREAAEHSVHGTASAVCNCATFAVYGEHHKDCNVSIAARNANRWAYTCKKE